MQKIATFFVEIPIDLPIKYWLNMCQMCCELLINFPKLIILIFVKNYLCQN